MNASHSNASQYPVVLSVCGFDPASLPHLWVYKDFHLLLTLPSPSQTNSFISTSLSASYPIIILYNTC
jgi:hypothetical protein